MRFQLYRLDNDNDIEVVIKGETIWATQKSLGKLFDVGTPAISKHLKNIFEAGELDEKVVVSKMETTTQHGALARKTQSKLTNYYNLDAIISVGYRVNSLKATRFRQWATVQLRDLLTKGFVVDSERLEKGSNPFGEDYFQELLETVRSIRTSERRIWLKITDIFVEISVDYDKDSPLAHDFFSMVQNKFHYAITGETAAEIIYSRVDHQKENMGLTSWKNSPEGRIIKSDVIIAKNYLQEKEIRRLERNVSVYFDYVEDLLEDETLLTMKDFAESIDAFLRFRRFKILEGKGRISKKQADAKAHTEYDIFNKSQTINSDFEKHLLSIARGKTND